MKRQRMQRKSCLTFTVILSLLLLVVADPAEAQDEPLPPPTNPLQIATLHWYAANQTTQFPLGGFPTGIAFDGEHLWVGNLGANSIMKLRPSDGTILATYPVPDPYVCGL